MAYSELISSQRADSDFIKAHIKAVAGEKLSELEIVKLEINNTSQLRLAENSFYQLREGYYTDAEFEGEKNWWCGFMLNSRTRVGVGLDLLTFKEVDRWL